MGRIRKDEHIREEAMELTKLRPMWGHNSEKGMEKHKGIAEQQAIYLRH